MSSPRRAFGPGWTPDGSEPRDEFLWAAQLGHCWVGYLWDAPAKGRRTPPRFGSCGHDLSGEFALTPMGNCRACRNAELIARQAKGEAA